ncbi:glycosyltransferase [Gimesia algae]|uniref:Glycosyl transferase family 2 n=1 Tax=Gimesia algae TaxID=2527971 RepID=A0A517VN62_9PLAN|nr:glycosyltransferase family 2 protein [Gimesia algae]QDT94471.1 Glycosyl transferase family 2 [Gimesia algae]
MYLLATVSSLCLIIFAVFYLYWGSHAARLYRGILNQSTDEDYTPVATVILPLRGNDPFLVHCLDGLLNQDYPDYRVKIVVDHVSDPALGFVKQYLRRHPHPQCEVSIRRQESVSCGLKNASLVQAIQTVSADVEVVAWLDADVLPHRRWLRDLVSPLREAEVGIASGIRWYAPQSTNAGTLVRHAWNAAAVLQMLSMDIAWGGSIALSRSVFQDPRLSDTLSKMMWDDTGLKSIANQLNQKLVFAPAATMINAESIAFDSSLQFITRQMVNARFYHSHFWFIATLGFVSALAQTVLVGLGLLFLQQGQQLAAGLVSGVLVFAGAAVAFSIYRLGSRIEQLVRSRGGQFRRHPLKTLGYLWLMPYLFCGCLIAAIRTRTINWRGVIYYAPAPFEVYINHYEPFQKAAPVSVRAELENVSI